MDEFALNVEHCRNFREFLLLTKQDFLQEHYTKRVLYEKEFENMDCRNLVKNYLHAVTLTQTFSDDFTFFKMDLNYIPCSSMHSKKRGPINEVVPPCELAKMHLIMIGFVHSQIEHVDPFSGVYDFKIHKKIGNNILFHDHLIEHWMCELALDVVSEQFSRKESHSYAKECVDIVKQNVYIIFDKITWNNENGGEENLVVYV